MRVLIGIALTCLTLNDFAAAKEGVFNKVIIPISNLHTFKSIKLLCLSDCISLCLISDDDNCEAVVHNKNDGSCSFGRFIVPAGTKRKIISKDKAGPDDIVIYGRETAIKPRSGYVPVLLSVFTSDVTQTKLSSTPEVTGDETSSVVGTKPLGDLAGAGIPSFGFVACGGELSTGQVTKTCRCVAVYCFTHWYCTSKQDQSQLQDMVPQNRTMVSASRGNGHAPSWWVCCDLSK